jgi:hypothetical protein
MGVQSEAKAAIDKVPEAKRIDKLFPLGDPKRIEALRNTYPEAFEELRQIRMARIAKQAEVNGEISPRRLATLVAKLPEETKQLIFGQGAAKKAAALKTYLDSVPAMVGPSGTPAGLNIFNLVDVAVQGKSLGNRLFYEFLTSSQKVGARTEALGKLVGSPAATGLSIFTARQARPNEERTGVYTPQRAP